MKLNDAPKSVFGIIAVVFGIIVLALLVLFVL